MELKKSYKGFIIWMVVFTLVLTGLSFLSIQDVALMVRLIDILSALAITLLMLIIYKTEQIYWINGVDYKTAALVGSERRKAYALAHLKHFGLFSAVFLLYTVIAWMLDVSYWIDLVIFCVGLVATAISTIRIHL